jgi:enoyl-CoA hydratase/carnithine racemase
MAFPEVNQNLIPGLNGTVRLPSIIGKNQALLMIMAGDTINASDAKKIGLIDYIAPKDGALDFSQNLMNKMIKDRPLHVINAIMRALNNSDKLPPDLSGKEETRLFCELARTEIHRRKAEGDGSC